MENVHAPVTGVTYAGSRDRRTRLCIVTTHPIQYMAPWFRELSVREDLALHVVFLRRLSDSAQGTGFGAAFQWDVPVLQGYSSESLNLAPGLSNAVALVRKLSKVFSTTDPHIVLVTGWNESLLVVTQLFTRVSGRRLLIRGESNSLRHRSALARVLHQSLLKLAHGFLSIGRKNHEFYRENGVDETRIYPGTYFVESDRMLAMANAHRGERWRLREARGFDDDDVVLLFCGKHVPFKRPQLLIEAAAKLRDEGASVKVLYAGSGELSHELVAAAQRLDVPVHFEGFLNQTELWRAYLSADVFVLPSNNGETWGLVVNEAMLFGLPVLVSNEVGSRYDLVVDGVTGFGFEPNAAAIADAIRPLVADASLRQSMGEKGRERVKSLYSSHVATDGLIQAIKRLCR
jgi:glycosyltransferase involved in cell wall biosynthesis